MSGERVLVIDDKPENIELLTEYMLRPKGYIPLVATNGEEGLHVALTHRPDLIILDLKMPKMSGLQVLQALKERKANIPSILMTGYGSEHIAVQAFRLGVRDYITRPFEVDEMLDAISRALDEEPLLKKQKAQRANLEQRETLKKQVDLLQRMLQVSHALNSSLGLESLLQTIIEIARELTETEASSLLLLDKETNQLHFAAATGVKSQKLKSISVPIDSIAGWIVRKGRPLLVPEVRRDPRFFRQVDAITGYATRSILGVPLKIKERIIGAIEVLNKAGEKIFTLDDARILTILAAQAAIAVENARLFTEVKNEKDKLQTLINSTADSIILTIGEDDRILLINEAARKALSIEATPVVDKPLAEVMSNEWLIDLFARSHADSKTERAEIPLADGRTLNANLTLIPTVGRVLVMQDITPLKKLDEMKSDFVTTFVHDLRSPLTSIRGFVDLLPMVGKLNDRQCDSIARIQRNVANITALIDDLLDIGLIEASIGLEMDICHLDLIVTEVVDHSRRRAEAKEQHLQLISPASLPPVLGNPLRLSQAVRNLLDNAIKYTPPGGRITVQIGEEGDQIIVQVKDTGIGIPVADKPYIFDKFYRVRSEETKDIEGTGLGLYIVKSIVDKHNGRVWVESKAGEGSTFTFILPKY